MHAFLWPLRVSIWARKQRDLIAGQLAGPEFTESRKLRGLSLLTLPFYQEEAGRLFVLSPRILCAYLAFALFPSIMAVLSR